MVRTRKPASPARETEPQSRAELLGAPSPFPVGVAVVGAGYWGPRLIRNFQASADAEVVAVCDADPERLDAVRGQHRDVRCFRAMDELLACPAVQAVAIATPVHTHHALAKAALLSGKHVLIEKPLASSLAEAEELVELAASRGLVLAVDHTFLFHPAVRKMRELVEGGALGRLLYYDSVRINLGLFQPDINVAWDLAPHDLSILMYLRPGRPETVSATGASHWRRGTENIAYLTLRYDDGFLAHVHVSWLAPVKVRQTILAGDQRMVIYDDNQVLEKIKVYDKGIDDPVRDEDELRARLVGYRTGDMRSPHLDGREALAVEVSEFLRAVRVGEPFVSDGRLGLEVVRVLDAAEESMRRGGAPVVLA